MKISTKIMAIVTLSFFFLGVSGCSKKEENIPGNLEDIMAKVYASIPEEERPMYLENREVTKENAESYIGTSDIDFKEALASEPMVTSSAHSVVLVRMNDTKNIEDAKAKIKEKVDPRKWICVGVENVIVESRGDLIIVILDDTNGEKILNDFKKLETK